MNRNILGLGYEALLQPCTPMGDKCKNCNAVISAEELHAAKIKFFGLDRLFQQNNQKVK